MMRSAVEFSILTAEVTRQGGYMVVKRLMDVTLSLLALICLAPLLAVCAVAIILDSPGPVLFRQKRVGERGKVFTLLKFRSMSIHADQAPHRAYAAAFIRGEAMPQAAGGGEVYKLVDDARVTRVGRWLRRTSLDELPQLWNVLRGEMSLVGPRPPIPYELEHYEPVHLYRLAIKPGITGLWQVSSRSTSTFDEMVAIDIDYIHRASPALDLRILLKTIPAVLGGRGAH